MSENPDEQRAERKVPLWGHVSMFILSMVMAAGLATSSEWNPLQVVSGLAFAATIPATIAVWIILKINRAKMPDSLERKYMMAAYAAVPWMGGGVLAIAVMRTVDDKWAALGIGIGVAITSIAVLWNLGRYTWAMLGRTKERLGEKPEPATGD